MDRVRKITFEVLKDHRSDFGINFDENKAALEAISIVRSKTLKNKISGRITRAVKRELFEKEEKLKTALYLQKNWKQTCSFGLLQPHKFQKP